MILQVLIQSATTPPVALTTLLGIAVLGELIIIILLVVRLVRQQTRARETLNYEVKRNSIVERDDSRLVLLRELAENWTREQGLLDEMDYWLVEYRRGEATAERAEEVMSKAVAQIAHDIRLAQEGRTGEITKFNPRYHRTYSDLQPGDLVTIVQPGWTFAGKKVSLPLVEAK